MATHHLHQARAATPFTAADRALRSKKDHDAVRDIWLLLASVLAFFTVVNVVRKVYAKFSIGRSAVTEVSGSDPEKSETVAQRQPGSRLHRLCSALATAFRIVVFRLPVPIGPNAFASVSELTFIFVYIAANLLWLFIDTRRLNVNFYKSRAGIMASAQLPLVVALASKNNVISWMTGLNVLHRAAGRTMFLLLWIHTIGRAVTTLPPKVSFDDYFMEAGIVGIGALTAGVFLSLNIFRQALFEFFFVTHFVLMLIFLIGGYIHLHEQGYGSYVWPALLVWGVDRVFRTIRLVWHNLFRLDESAKGQAQVELLASDTIRLTFRRKFHWKPGQHAYISLPKISKLPSESHPFTIASIPGNIDGTESQEQDVVFLIRSRGGLTRRLKEFTDKSGTGSVAAYIDGPYGCPPDLHQYTTCVLVAGGSGISYTLPLLLDLIRRSAIGGSSEVRRVVFIWAVRGDGQLPWITEALSKALPLVKHPLVVETRIYITGTDVPPTTWPAESSNSISKSEKDQVFVEPESTGNTPRIHHGRPNIASLLHDEISASLGSVSVDVAGPGAMTASVREALTTGAASPGAVLKGSPSVTLHVETFGMVRA
ncbi:hypothetical protein H1R20_g6887, partial [Candolleomyces eurysporus]